MNKILLEHYMSESKYNNHTLAKEIGIGYTSLYRKKNGITEFTASEIESLCRVLKIKKNDRGRIFFD